MTADPSGSVRLPFPALAPRPTQATSTEFKFHSRYTTAYVPRIILMTAVIALSHMIEYYEHGLWPAILDQGP